MFLNFFLYKQKHAVLEMDSGHKAFEISQNRRRIKSNSPEETDFGESLLPVPNSSRLNLLPDPTKFNNDKFERRIQVDCDSLWAPTEIAELSEVCSNNNPCLSHI